MIGAINTIKINGTDIFRPTDFSPARENIYAAEITTCTGKTIADLIGWKYSDMTMQWDTLPQDQLDELLAMSGECTLIFDDADGTEHTETIIPTTQVWVSTRTTKLDGSVVWKDISVGVRFINAHN